MRDSFCGQIDAANYVKFESRAAECIICRSAEIAICSAFWVTWKRRNDLPSFQQPRNDADLTPNTLGLRSIVTSGMLPVELNPCKPVQNPSARIGRSEYLHVGLARPSGKEPVENIREAQAKLGGTNILSVTFKRIQDC